MGRGVYRSYSKGPMDKIKEEGRGQGGKWEWQVCGVDRGKMETTILEQQ